MFYPTRWTQPCICGGPTMTRLSLACYAECFIEYPGYALRVSHFDMNGLQCAKHAHGINCSMQRAGKSAPSCNSFVHPRMPPCTISRIRRPNRRSQCSSVSLGPTAAYPRDPERAEKARDTSCPAPRTRRRTCRTRPHQQYSLALAPQSGTAQCLQHCPVCHGRTRGRTTAAQLPRMYRRGTALPTAASNSLAEADAPATNLPTTQRCNPRCAKTAPTWASAPLVCHLVRRGQPR